MKKALLPLAVLGLALSATGAIAALEDFMGADADNSGAVSWAEFSLLYPEVTEQQFASADTDSDGELSQGEFDTLILQTGAVGGSPPALPDDQPLPQSLTYDKPAS